MGTAAVGARARMAIETALPFDAGSYPLEFVGESLQRRGTIIDTAGLRGTRSHAQERTRQGPYTIRGQIVLNPSHRDLDVLLPWILGGSETGGDTFALAETVPTRYLWIDRVTRGFVYEGCVVTRATLRAGEGTLLELTLDVEASREGSDDAGTFVPDVLAAGGALATALGATSLGTSADDAPFAFHDAALTMQGAPRAIQQFELVVENVAETARFMNSTYRAQVPVIDRLVRLRCICPYTSDEAVLYAQPLAGASASLVLTNGVGGAVLTCSLAALQVPALSPVVDGRGEIRLRIEGTARKSGTTSELVVTNVP